MVRRWGMILVGVIKSFPTGRGWWTCAFGPLSYGVIDGGHFLYVLSAVAMCQLIQTVATFHVALLPTEQVVIGHWPSDPGILDSYWVMSLHNN